LSRAPIDISRTIADGAPVYPGDTPPAIGPRCQLSRGDPYNILEFRFSGHVLTHVDAPRHFLPGGAAMDELPPERFMGPAEVIEVDGPAVEPEHVPQAAAGLNLLFKTRNSSRLNSPEFDAGYVYISAAAAETIVERGANLVGIDYLSIDRYGDETYPAHHTLLGAGIVVLEGIDLSGVEAGRYTLVALPLKISGGDGSPVRAVLIPADESSLRAE
jgi:arylformamidase